MDESVLEAGPLLSRKATKRFVRRGLKAASVIFVIELVAFSLTVTLPFFSGEQQSYSQSAKQIVNQLSGASPLGQVGEIFANNMKVALIEFVPGFGAFFFGASVYETARITQAIALNMSFPAEVLVAALLLLPHSWIELPAYAVSTAEGIFLLYALVRWFVRRETARLRVEFGQLLLSLIVVGATLIVAAVFEVAEVQLGAAGLAMWAPFGLIVAIAILLKRKYSSESALGPDSIQTT